MDCMGAVSGSELLLMGAWALVCLVSIGLAARE